MVLKCSSEHFKENLRAAPRGEKPIQFEFSPSGGKIHLRGSDERLTAYGGMVAWDHNLSRIGIFETLVNAYPQPPTSPNATPSKDFPTDDAVADSLRTNQLIEDFVRQAPEQYFWVHRRFKRRGKGYEDVYR